MPDRAICFWRWRFQPVWGPWGHLGVDYTFEHPQDRGRCLLRHIDYGLPGDPSVEGYRWSIALYCAMVSPGGKDWPPLRTPRGRIFSAGEFRPAPRIVGEYLQSRLPRFFGRCGAYRSLGPNSNSGLRCALELCERETGYRFEAPPLRMRFGAVGWSWRGELPASDGPYPGYFHSDAFRFRQSPNTTAST